MRKVANQKHFEGDYHVRQIMNENSDSPSAGLGLVWIAAGCLSPQPGAAHAGCSYPCRRFYQSLPDISAEATEGCEHNGRLLQAVRLRLPHPRCTSWVEQENLWTREVQHGLWHVHACIIYTALFRHVTVCLSAWGKRAVYTNKDVLYQAQVSKLALWLIY